LNLLVRAPACLGQRVSLPQLAPAAALAHRRSARAHHGRDDQPAEIGGE
jgi:hypothetical protein